MRMTRTLAGRLRRRAAALGLWLAWLAAAPAAWAAVAGIEERTAEETASKLVAIGKDVLYPLGAMTIFGAVALTAFKIIVTAHKPEERVQALSAIPYILGGGIALGAVMLLAGFALGLMVRAGQ